MKEKWYNRISEKERCEEKNYILISGCVNSGALFTNATKMHFVFMMDNLK